MSIAPNVTIIPAKAQTEISHNKYQQLRVAAYCRVSTAEEEQQNSYQVQIAYYTDLINKKKEWSLVSVFAEVSATLSKLFFISASVGGLSFSSILIAITSLSLYKVIPLIIVLKSFLGINKKFV